MQFATSTIIAAATAFFAVVTEASAIPNAKAVRDEGLYARVIPVPEGRIPNKRQADCHVDQFSCFISGGAEWAQSVCYCRCDNDPNSKVWLCVRPRFDPCDKANFVKK